MSKEEPAWKAELRKAMDERFPFVRNTVTRDAIREFCESQILAAEQRGFQAGVNKTGDSVGKLREQLKTAEERGRQQALSAIGAEIDVMLSNIPALKARPTWKAGYEGALGYLSVLVDSIMPDKP